MPGKYIVDDLKAVLDARSVYGVTTWNRLEGRPRAEKFDRALRAEVRDALWMIARQWQMGELRGDDAGSPIKAKVHLESTRLRKYQAVHGGVEDFDDGTPLEARVEPRPITFSLGGHSMSLDLRLLMGRYWLKLVQSLEPLAPPQFIASYPITVPDHANAANAPTVAHVEAWSSVAAAAAASHMMDGGRFFEHLTVDGGAAADGIASLVGKETQAAALAERFVAWFRKLIVQPDTQGAWEADRLEYRFTCAAPQGPDEKVLVADEYYHGHLDWHNLDVDPAQSTIGDAVTEATGDRTPHTLTMVPTQATFNGMPNSRWWAFEDGRTNFGDIKPDTTDLAKLLLIEFGLVYANDWFVVPFTVPAGTLATVRGMAVTNVFGERTWVEAAGRGDDDEWQRWAMFLMSTRGQGHQAADLSLAVLPVAQNVLNGSPLEALLLARDEMANMVWGVEKTIALPSGESKHGGEAGNETRAYFLRDFERRHGHPPIPPPGAPGARIRYSVMSEVPEHWIPMIPVHVEGDNREVQLQRAAMLRILEGDAVGGVPVDPSPVRPRTSLLRVGLEGAGAPAAYFVHEEEVPRAGARVTQGFRRTRWRDGRAWVWLAVRKQTGRGEGSSGLAFDRLVDLPEAPAA